MTTPSETLIRRLEDAEVGSFDLDKALLAHFGFTWRGMAYWNAAGEIWSGPRALTRSIDAALALVERVLPGSKPGVMVEERIGERVQWGAWVSADLSERPTFAWSPALALCIAMLKALEPQDDRA